MPGWSRAGDGWGVIGDPMEGALVALAAKAGLDADHLRAEWPRRDEIPFAMPAIAPWQAATPPRTGAR